MMVFTDAALRNIPPREHEASKVWSQRAPCPWRLRALVSSTVRDLISWHGRLDGFVAAETLKACAADDHAFVARKLCEEMVGSPLKCFLVTDS